MTTPSNPPEEGIAPSEEPAGPAETTAPVPAAATPAGPAEATPPPGPVAPPPGAPGYPWGPGPYPFAPVARAPRTPWVNPARRAHVVAAAIAGALIFGGGGLLIGHAISDHGRGERHIVRVGPGEGMNRPGLQPGQRPRVPFGPGQRNPRGRNVPAPSTTPSGSPTK